MSAYVVSNETISVLAKAIVEYGIETREVVFDSMALMLVNYRYEPIGQWLLQKNYDSVNARYNENTEPHEFKYEEPKEFNEGIIYGCIRCFEYQACEVKDYDESGVHYVMENLTTALLERMIKQKGYEIPWGVE